MEENKIYDLEKYNEKRSLINGSDHEIRVAALKKGYSFQDKSAHFLITEIFRKNRFDYFQNCLKDKPLFDIGAGEGGGWNVLRMKGYPVTYTDFADERDLGIKEFVLVDPFISDESVHSQLEQHIGYAFDVPKNKQQEMHDSIRGDQRDGLSFLLDQKVGSGNILVASINYSLIPNTDYLKRIAQEAYRIVPKEGVLMACDSDDIEEEASQLFPYSQNFGVATIFSKSQILSDEHMDRKSRQRQRALLRLELEKITQNIKSGEQKNET
tara:strand:+ start:803 stop:1606 length:804 start_codon:yes stop_codon:yes gene_type:complete